MGVEGSIREEREEAAAGGKRLVASGGEVYNRPSGVSTNPASGLSLVEGGFVSDESHQGLSLSDREFSGRRV